ncbi:zf-HC2 domain-containing protein [Actinophytocola oryzae]|uniref:zf-HC2 domain-containing protein n=1 Tax=Actinophytocola oryzae TaxID=502181 RepID=UPI0010629FC9|nr:zf-HC2 domain-containing protein [Actinophytocola oryzae]
MRAHRRLRESLGVYVLGRLDGDELLTVQAHVARCRRCREEVAELAVVVELLERTRPTARMARRS